MGLRRPLELAFPRPGLMLIGAPAAALQRPRLGSRRTAAGARPTHHLPGRSPAAHRGTTRTLHRTHPDVPNRRPSNLWSSAVSSTIPDRTKYDPDRARRKRNSKETGERERSTTRSSAPPAVLAASAAPTMAAPIGRRPPIGRRGTKPHESSTERAGPHTGSLTGRATAPYRRTTGQLQAGRQAAK